MIGHENFSVNFHVYNEIFNNLFTSALSSANDLMFDHKQRPESDFILLAGKMNYEYENIQYLIDAFNVEKIYEPTDGENRDNYISDAMATLGDAILGAAIATYLYGLYKDRKKITDCVSAIVNNNNLEKIADILNLKMYQFDNSATHSTGELGWNTRKAGTRMEAIVCAIYLDKGYDYVCDWSVENIAKKKLLTQIE